MTKNEIVKQLADTTGQSPKSVEAVLNSLAGLVKTEIAAGNEVVVPGIAKFFAKVRPAREGRNPSTQQKQTFPAKNVVHAKPAKELRDAAPAPTA